MSSRNPDPSIVSVSSGDVAPDSDADVESAVSLLNRVLVTVPPVIRSCSSLSSLYSMWPLIASLHDTLGALVDSRIEELERCERERKYYAELQSQFDQRLRRPYPNEQTLRDLMQKTQMTETENDPSQLITSGLLDPEIHQDLNIYKVPRPIIIQPAVDLQTALQDQHKQQQTQTQTQTQTKTQTNATPTIAPNSNLSSSSSGSVPFPYPCVVSPSDRSRIISYMLSRGFVVAPDPSSYPVSAMWLTAPSIGCGFILLDEHGKDINHDITSPLWKGIQGNNTQQQFQIPI